jgi:hypothetical protein
MRAGNTEDMLREAISAAADFLDVYGVKGWVRRLRYYLQDRVDPTDVLSEFGGMGSLTDLVISADNGHLLRKDQEEEVNQRWMELSAHFGLIARGLRRARAARSRK